MNAPFAFDLQLFARGARRPQRPARIDSLRRWAKDRVAEAKGAEALARSLSSQASAATRARRKGAAALLKSQAASYRQEALRLREIAQRHRAEADRLSAAWGTQRATALQQERKHAGPARPPRKTTKVAKRATRATKSAAHAAGKAIKKAGRATGKVITRQATSATRKRSQAAKRGWASRRAAARKRSAAARKGWATRRVRKAEAARPHAVPRPGAVGAPSPEPARPRHVRVMRFLVVGADGRPTLIDVWPPAGDDRKRISFYFQSVRHYLQSGSDFGLRRLEGRSIYDSLSRERLPFITDARTIDDAGHLGLFDFDDLYHEIQWMETAA